MRVLVSADVSQLVRGRIRVIGDRAGSYSCVVLRRLGWEGSEAETAEVPLKSGKDPTESC